MCSILLLQKELIILLRVSTHVYTVLYQKVIIYQVGIRGDAACVSEQEIFPCDHFLCPCWRTTTLKNLPMQHSFSTAVLLFVPLSVVSDLG